MGLTRSGTVRPCRGVGCQSMLRSTLLVDDDVLELDRARKMGMQAFAAPAEGGLQEDDFNLIVGGLQRPCAKLPSIMSRTHASCEPLAGKPAKWRNYILFPSDLTLFES